MLDCHLPHPHIAAVAISAITASPDPYVKSVLNSNPEPYRRAAYMLGWGEWDGTPWWDTVMELIG